MAGANKRAALTAWLTGALAASALLALIWLFGDLRYAGNDDAPMARIFMGFDCTQTPDFHLYLHPILVYPLRWLSMAIPGVAWFSWMQLAFIWFACALGVKSLMQLFARAGRALWGLLASAVYLALFAMTYFCRVTYTVTAAMLGAAAVLQLLSLDAKNASGKSVVRSLLLALLPVVLAYCMRQITVLPLLAFCGLALAYVAWRGYERSRDGARLRSLKTYLKPYLCFALIAAILFAGLVVGRELEIGAKGMQDYLRWQRARISVVDYIDLDSLPDELLSEIGWSQRELALVKDWYFLDADISAEAFEKITAYQAAQPQPGLTERLAASARLVSALRTQEPTAYRSALALAAALLLCAAALLLRRKGVLPQWLCLIAGVLLTIVMLLYLGLQGRLPLRAALNALLPFAALVFGLLPQCLPPKSEARPAARAVLAVLSCGVLALSAWYAIPAAKALLKTPDEQLTEDERVNPFADLDELAADNPDILFIYDATFASDMRMFPTTEFGTPHNVMFWGGWGARSPEYMQRLAAFDIDGSAADASIFLREDVRLARGVIDPGPDALWDYLIEQYGDNVDYMLDMDWGGVHTGQFWEY